ncbi:FtsX-like permease family protein [Streptomyces sp. NPDC048663]|uniref:FtsX-like permease family protein n=1 Tax=Streptomyces sp. NPDC048663 TaxID=3155638 RepID=UPI00344036F6
MLSLAAQMLRFRKGSFIATFIALAGGVAILMTCALLVESGWRYHGEPQRYARTVAVVADRDLTVTQTTLGDKDSTTIVLPERGSVQDSLVSTIAAVPGVSKAVGDRSIPVTLMAAPKIPVTGHGWGSAALAPYKVVSGVPPRSDDEVAVDERLAAAGGLHPGARTAVVARGAASTMRVSAIVRTDGRGGYAAVFFTDTRALRLDPHPGRFDAIGVLAEPGADQPAVINAVRRLAAIAQAKVYVGEERGLAEEPDAAAARDLSLQAGGALGGYAVLIIVFVAASTVGLSVRYRRRELALLRAIAATPGQIRAVILGEVTLLSMLAAAIGVPSGLAAARWIRDELVDRSFVPDTFTVQGGPLSALAVIAAVTLVALSVAWIAALRTTRIRPSEALGESAVEKGAKGKFRLVSGLVALAGGTSLIGVTGATNGETALGAAVSMLYTFVLAVALLAPWINQGAARFLAPVLRTMWGNSGYLAAANLRANARGMVAVLTALVLAIGFGSTVWFLQDNLQRQTEIQAHDGTLAQYALVSGTGLPASATARARQLPGVEAATGIRRSGVIVTGQFGPQSVIALGIDPRDVRKTLDLGVRSGDIEDVKGKGTAAVSTSLADSSGWHIGDKARMWLGDGTPISLRIVAVYDRGFGFGDVTLDNATLAGHTVTGLDDHVLIRASSSAFRGQVTAELAALARRYPAAAATGTDQLTADLAKDLAISAWLNKMLILVLVGYSVLAAANTLIMAALARTREVSLLRLVGVTRRQITRMVYAEQAGLLGAALAIGGTIALVTLSSVVNAISGTRVPYVPTLGWVTIIVGTVTLALAATRLPIGRLLRVSPVEGIGLRE